MYELNVQKYLREYGIDALVNEFHINVKRHKDIPQIFLLKYDMINSPRDNEIVKECRGLILDEKNNFAVVAFPFQRFFNAGEGPADDIDWTNVKVQTKIDGSLTFLYYYGDNWHVSSSGLPDASGPVNNSGKTFKNLFWDTFGEVYGYAMLDTDLTYVFELTGPENRVLVPHEKPDLTLIGLRNIKTGQEIDIDTYDCKFKKAQSHPLGSLEELFNTFMTLDPMRNEGYVCVEKSLTGLSFKRIKVKHFGYVALAHAKDGVGSSDRNILEIVVKAESSEFLSVFPEFKERFDNITTKYKALIAELHTQYDSIKHIESQKDFALALKSMKCRCTGALYTYRANKVASVEAFLREMHIDKLLEIVNS